MAGNVNNGTAGWYGPPLGRLCVQIVSPPVHARTLR